MSQGDIDLLVLRHLADLDAATKKLTQLEELIFAKIDRVVEGVAQDEGWGGEFHFMKKGIWLAPKTWKQKDGSYRGFFELDLGHGDSGEGVNQEDYFFLTRLCGVGDGEMGFRFKSSVYGTKLRTFSKEAASTLARTPFSPDSKGWWFMPVRIEHAKLVEALEGGDLDAGLEAIEDQLKALVKAKPAFDKFLDRLPKK